ncbi:hypothetical protein EDD37DRAFT_624098 [Exophiala viscosa]|uniref:uncharacterized protein n=1 Tax=Exophiala viscosa TaxID=2486360 RepID=UPI00218E23D0|nr:hypothetical protein EDD37DRAFT_624098 [Exophiala viscosa]
MVLQHFLFQIVVIASLRTETSGTNTHASIMATLDSAWQSAAGLSSCCMSSTFRSAESLSAGIAGLVPHGEHQTRRSCCEDGSNFSFSHLP